jgi:hypothetical protein
MRQAERLGQEEEEQQAAAAAATSSKQVLGGGILLREPEREVEAPSTSQPHKQTPAGPRVMAALAPGDSDEVGVVKRVLLQCGRAWIHCCHWTVGVCPHNPGLFVDGACLTGW